MKQSIIVVYMLVLSFVLSACFYPNERLTENQLPHPDQLEAVQRAINLYREDTGVLPIETREADTPIFEKYIVDFKKLVPRYLSFVPGNAFESGGVFRYVLIHVEDNPEVKVLDLRLTQEVSSLQQRLNEYLRRHTYLPVAEIIDERYFRLDYSKLKLRTEPLVRSPFTKQYLPFIVDQEGRVGIDYRLDIGMYLQANTAEHAEDEDARYLLVEGSYFVPSYSFPITIMDGEPVYRK